MAKAVKKARLAASGEKLGEQLLQSVLEMKAGLRGRVHTPEVASQLAETAACIALVQHDKLAKYEPR